MCSPCSIFFFFNDTATTEIYTLSLHDALPISCTCAPRRRCGRSPRRERGRCPSPGAPAPGRRRPDRVRRREGQRPRRSEEHTSELQSHLNLVCRLLLEKKKNKKNARSSQSCDI